MTIYTVEPRRDSFAVSGPYFVRVLRHNGPTPRRSVATVVSSCTCLDSPRLCDRRAQAYAATFGAAIVRPLLSDDRQRFTQVLERIDALASREVRSHRALYRLRDLADKAHVNAVKVATAMRAHWDAHARNRALHHADVLTLAASHSDIESLIDWILETEEAFTHAEHLSLALSVDGSSETAAYVASRLVAA